MSEIEKKYKNADETLEIIKKNLDYNKNAQKNIQHASKADKEKSKPKPEESIAERTKLRKGRIAEIEKEEKNINNELFKKYFTNYQSPNDMHKNLYKTGGERNEAQVYLIEEVLNRLKTAIKICLRIKNI